MTVPIRTARLELIAATALLLRAEHEDRDEFSRLLAAHVPDGWPPDLLVDANPFFREQLERDPALEGWLAWYWVRQGTAEAERELVGSGGFKGPPGPDGTIEMGYSVLPEHQGHGYATEAVQALMGWAIVQPGVSSMAAETSPGNTPSVRLLERVGFRSAGPGAEPGLIRFELQPEPSRRSPNHRGANRGGSATTTNATADTGYTTCPHAGEQTVL